MALITARTGDEVEAAILTYAKVRRGKCGKVQAIVIYKKLIHEVDHEGEHYAVYLAHIRGVPLFVVMQGWRHESI